MEKSLRHEISKMKCKVLKDEYNSTIRKGYEIVKLQKNRSKSRTFFVEVCDKDDMANPLKRSCLESANLNDTLEEIKKFQKLYKNVIYSLSYKIDDKLISVPHEFVLKHLGEPKWKNGAKTKSLAKTTPKSSTKSIKARR